MVEDVSVQVTRVRLLTGELWSVPNMKFVDQPVENLSSRRYIRRIMEINLPFGTSEKKVRRTIEVLEELLRSEEVVGDGEGDTQKHPPKINFTEIAEYSLNLRVDYYYLMHPSGTVPQRDSDRGWFTYLDHCSRVNALIIERFAEEGIEFAFPTQTIELEKGLPEAATANDLEGQPAT